VQLSTEIGGFKIVNLREAVSQVTGVQPHGVEDATDGGRMIALRIPAKAEYITLCRLALTGLGQLRGIPDDTMADLKLALTEAVSNSVRHAYGPNGDGSVDVRYELHPDRLAVEVVDDGHGFDPEVEAGTEPEGDELTEGGLGIAIIKSIADEFDLRTAPGERGSTLRFVKRLS
jgi:serine/threonine-protein kinase RsbW